MLPGSGIRVRMQRAVGPGRYSLGTPMYTRNENQNDSEEAGFQDAGTLTSNVQ